VDQGNAPDSSPIDAGIHAAAREPYPPRRWWLKRIALASASSSAAIHHPVRHAWHYVRRSASASRHRQDQSGRRTALSPRSSTDSMRTTPSCSWSRPVVVVLDGCFAFVGSDDEFISSCGILVENYAEALDLVRQARNRPLARWPTKAQSPLLDFEICNLAAQRSPSRSYSVYPESAGSCCIHNTPKPQDRSAISSPWRRWSTSTVSLLGHLVALEHRRVCTACDRRQWR
jgi:hypothetical protein